MRVARRSLGDASACGENPCTLWDYVWVSDECSAYLSCAGLPAMTFSGQLGAGVQSITSGAASVVGAGVSGATSNISTDLLLLAIGVGAIAFFTMVK